jgi:hypothetical protein
VRQCFGCERRRHRARAASCDALGVYSMNYLDGDSGECGASSGDILITDEGNDTLHVDDDSGAVCAECGNNVSVMM